MKNIIKNKKDILFIIFIICTISFFVLPRFFAGLRLEELICVISTLFFLPYFIVLVFKYKVFPCLIYIAFLVFSFILSLFSDVLYSDLNLFNWIYFFKYFIYLSFLFLGFYCAKYKILEKRSSEKVIFFCISINIIWIIYQIGSSNFGSLLASKDISFYGIALIGEAAAFQVGSILSLIVFLMIIYFNTSKNIFFKTAISLCCFLSIYAVYLSQSRVNLLGVLIGSAILVFYYINNKWRLFYSGFLFLCLFYFLFLKSISFNSENNRLTLDGILTSYQVRGMEIWNQPVDIIFNNIFYPNGLGALSHYNKNTNEMHNFYLKLWFEGGLFYLFLFLFFIFSIFILKNKYKSVILLKSYLFSLCISGFFQDSFSSNKAVIPLFFILGFCIYNLYFLERKYRA